MIQKKSQMTIFMVIGLLLLFIALFVAYTYIEESRKPVPDSYQSEKIPEQFNPVKSYITSCLEQVGTEGLIKLGQQGGYIEIIDNEYHSEAFKVDNNPTESDAVIFSLGSSLAVPYWYYLKSDNECTGECIFDSKRPDLRDTENSIEMQLERYVEKKVDNCLSDFKTLKEIGFDIEVIGERKVDVVISSEDVVVLMEYPLKAIMESESEMSKFYSRIPVNLERVYELSSKITNLQNEHRFLERAIINLIASFSNIDEDKLPPVNDMKFGIGGQVRWFKTKIKQKVIGVLTSYISLFQVDRTGNFEQNFFTSELKQRLYDAFIIPMTDGEYPDLRVNFAYLDFWDIYFDINCDGEMCGPESANSPILSMIGIQRYNFLYDVSYPVLVEVNEPDALNGQGYNFKYFLEANVRNNDPMPLDFNPITVDYGSKATGLCDYEQRQSDDITVVAVDSINKEPLEDVNVLFSVAGEGCSIGMTNEAGKLVAKYPTGTVGGYLSFRRQDYLGRDLLFDASTGENLIEISLDPIIEKNLVVVKKNIMKQGSEWNFIDEELELSEKEVAFVTITRDSEIYEEDFTSSVDFKKGDVYGTKIQVVPGNYHADISVLSYDDLAIPEKEVTEDGGWFADDVTYTIPGLEFSKEQPFPSGGLSFEFTVTEDDLRYFNTLKFTTVGADLKSIPEKSRTLIDFEKTTKYEEYSDTYSLFLEPRFVNR